MAKEAYVYAPDCDNALSFASASDTVSVPSAAVDAAGEAAETADGEEAAAAAAAAAAGLCFLVRSRTTESLALKDPKNSSSC